MPESRFSRLKLRPYTFKSNAIGGRQVLLTLVPAACHREFASLFANVKRVYCRDLLGTFRFQLWDPELQRIVARDTVDRALAMSAHRTEPRWGGL